jgi:hypothetical protein
MIVIPSEAEGSAVSPRPPKEWPGVPFKRGPRRRVFVAGAEKPSVGLSGMDQSCHPKRSLKRICHPEQTENAVKRSRRACPERSRRNLRFFPKLHKRGCPILDVLFTSRAGLEQKYSHYNVRRLSRQAFFPEKRLHIQSRPHYTICTSALNH